MKKKILLGILIILLLCAMFAGGYYIGTKFNKNDSNKKDVEKKEVDNKDQNKDTTDESEIVKTNGYIIATDSIKIDYSVPSIDDCSLKDGSLSGECSTNELKGKKIIDMTYGDGAFFSSVYVLTSDKELYYVEYDEDRKNVERIAKDEKITDLGYLISTSDCSLFRNLFLKKNNQIYHLVEENEVKQIRLFDKNKDIGVNGIGSCAEHVDQENGELNTTFVTYNKRVGNYNDNNVKIYKDDNNKEIFASYVVYMYKDNKETLFIIGEDNKFYELHKNEKQIKPVGEVEKVKYTPGMDWYTSTDGDPAVLEFVVKGEKKYIITEELE